MTSFTFLFYFERVEIFSSPGQTHRNSLRGMSLPKKQTNLSRATLVIRTCLTVADVVALVVQ